eukprot:jgi/Botrbrau1/10945/Bobra.0383s0002.1
MALNGVSAGLVRASAGTHTHRCLIGSSIPLACHLTSVNSVWDRQHAQKSASSSKLAPLNTRVRAVAAGYEVPRVVPPRSLMERSKSFSKPAELPEPHLAYEVVQGYLVRWSEVGKWGKPPPTAVLVHGILGSRKNMLPFAHRIVEGFPAWQVVLVDLRCHGESACLTSPTGGHSVQTAASDVLKLLHQLKLFPEVLIGHSFGGKVVMSMAHQFGSGTTRLPRPVQVWVLDALPGEVRAGGEGRKDHPADLIAQLRALPLPINGRTALQTYLIEHGFSVPIARWTSTNLQPVNGDHRQLEWTFDLQGIDDMYQSYEESCLWDFLSQPAQGICVDFVRAEHSSFKWAGKDEERIRTAGHGVHLLKDAGHWVHTDNPAGLYDILAPSFGSREVDMRPAPDLPL